jgi:hypothetical protein
MVSSGMRVYRRNNRLFVTVRTEFGTTVLADLSFIPNRELMFLELSVPAFFITNTNTQPEKIKYEFQSNTFTFKYEVKFIRVGHIH